jgi:hypothetical protein
MNQTGTPQVERKKKGIVSTKNKLTENKKKYATMGAAASKKRPPAIFNFEKLKDGATSSNSNNTGSSDSSTNSTPASAVIIKIGDEKKSMGESGSPVSPSARKRRWSIEARPTQHNRAISFLNLGSGGVAAISAGHVAITIKEPFTPLSPISPRAVKPFEIITDGTQEFVDESKWQAMTLAGSFGQCYRMLWRGEDIMLKVHRLEEDKRIAEEHAASEIESPPPPPEGSPPSPTTASTIAAPIGAAASDTKRGSIEPVSPGGTRRALPSSPTSQNNRIAGARKASLTRGRGPERKWAVVKREREQAQLRAAVPRELDFIIKQLMTHTKIIEAEATDGLVPYRAISGNPLYVLTPYMSGGSLQDMLEIYRVVQQQRPTNNSSIAAASSSSLVLQSSSGDSSTPTASSMPMLFDFSKLSVILKIGMEILNGIKTLHHASLSHGRLHMRNCLIDYKQRIVLVDYALGTTKLPVIFMFFHHSSFPWEDVLIQHAIQNRLIVIQCYHNYVNHVRM